ncbi:MAG: hypothetical protein SGPRY_008844 [Prymnesium sp.]
MRVESMQEAMPAELCLYGVRMVKYPEEGWVTRDGRMEAGHLKTTDTVARGRIANTQAFGCANMTAADIAALSKASRTLASSANSAASCTTLGLASLSKRAIATPVAIE